jgi:hypothetical protein
MTGASRLLAALGFLATTGLSPLSSAMAESSPDCTLEPSSKWIPAPEMRARIESLGYRFDVLKTTKGGCYEIYGRDKLGKRVEIYFNPLNGDVVRKSS